MIGIAINIGDDGAEQPVGLCAYLVRRPVVHAQGARTAADVDAKGLPGERLLEDALPKVAGKEQTIGTAIAKGRQE